MNSTAPVIRRCGRTYRPASAGHLSLDDLAADVTVQEKLEYGKDFFDQEEKNTLEVRVLRARIAALPLPRPSALLQAMDNTLDSGFSKVGWGAQRRALECLIRHTLREKV